MQYRILVVEDEETLAATYAEAFTSVGYEVTIAGDGYDALEKVIAGSFDLITMDLKLPRLNGIRASELIMHRRIPTPIIVISGYVPEHATDLERLGIHHVLHKPVDLDVLLDTVAKAIAEGREE